MSDYQKELESLFYDCLDYMYQDAYEDEDEEYEGEKHRSPIEIVIEVTYSNRGDI